MKLARKYSSQINLDTASLIIETDSSFTLKNLNFQKTFSAYRICECLASTYLGVITPLNLYIVSTVDMQNELAYTQLIDSKTGKSFEVPTNCDQGPQETLISPKNEFLLTYSNTYYGHDKCSVYLLKIVKGKAKNSYTLNNYFVINFDRLNIEQLGWINDKSFVMYVKEELNPGDSKEKKIKYFLKVELLK